MTEYQVKWRPLFLFFLICVVSSRPVLCKGLKNSKHINSVNLSGCSLSCRGAECLAAVIKVRTGPWGLRHFSFGVELSPLVMVQWPRGVEYCPLAMVNCPCVLMYCLCGVEYCPLSMVSCPRLWFIVPVFWCSVPWIWWIAPVLWFIVPVVWNIVPCLWWVVPVLWFFVPVFWCIVPCPCGVKYCPRLCLIFPVLWFIVPWLYDWLSPWCDVLSLCWVLCLDYMVVSAVWDVTPSDSSHSVSYYRLSLSLMHGL